MELLLADLIYADSSWTLDINEYIEEYQELIWTKRWQQCGDFVLNLPNGSLKTVNNYNDLINKVVILRSEIDTQTLEPLTANDYMIIEKVTLTYDSEYNEILTLEGRDFMSILGRRIIWGQQSFRSSQTLKSAVDTMITNAIISPSDSNRQINGFTIGNYTADTTIEASQVSYENVLETIIELCGDTYSPDVVLNNGSFVFTLYSGTDRTVNSNSPLVFSQRLDNLEKYEYLQDVSEYKNAWLCAGEGEGSARKTQNTYWSTGSADDNGVGLYRRELYIDAKDISSEDDSGTIPAATYNKMLLQRIEDKRLENWVVEASTAELTFANETYGVDYSVGDTASLIDPLGNIHTIRITEFIRSSDANGYKEYPNFTLT